ncbi:MAG TPA: alpha/beta hydrolase, partial [Micromonosporaceae bacterium]
MSDAGDQVEKGQRTVIRARDGRPLEVATCGPADGRVLVFHHGTPSAPVLFGPVVDAASDAGLRLVAYARPGYAGSERRPGRSVADVVEDVTDIADALGVPEFVTLGFSGGGPHALACAALLPERCLAAATIGGVAPFGATGLDWLAGMGPENIEEFGLAIEGPEALAPFLAGQAADLATVSAADIVAAFGGLLPAVDKEALTGVVAEWLAASCRRAVERGTDGWADDDAAFVAPWGFDLAQITVPVAIWQGSVDLMVPFAHGRWLADHVPTARAHLLEDHGHLSLTAANLP